MAFYTKWYYADSRKEDHYANCRGAQKTTFPIIQFIAINEWNLSRSHRHSVNVISGLANALLTKVLWQNAQWQIAQWQNV